eukprot:scaffold1802_cov146-Skeletonema_dohrnii-CCMP3373.AAC.2
MKHHIVQSIALFLAGIAAVTSQQVDPSTGVNNTLCSSIPAVDFFDAETGHVIFDTYPISSIETCLASLQVDKDHMIAHISALNKVFSHAFYNIARAPEASAPKDHQAELGYTLFNSPDEGVVDIDAEFTSIIQKVEEEGATLASFWEIQSVANRLRDGHVNLPSVNAEDLAGTVFFLPERCADGAVKGKHSFSNDPLTEELQLKIDWEDENGTKSESVVESMNGMTPYQFFLEVSNSPSIAGLVYQSRGARLNSLLTNMRSWSGNFIDALGEYNQVILPVRIDARPSDAYTPEVLVKYADGGEEMYHAYLKSNFMQQQITGYTDSTVDFNVTALEEHINKQGSSHAEMMQAIEGTFSVVDVDRTIPQPQPTGKEVRSVRSGEDEESESFFDTYNEAEAWALKFMDRYAVLKMESFDDIADEKLLIVWMALSRECKRQGITKLIVDISNNGGGKGILGPTLATLMYPTAAHNWYTKNNALVINEPMQIYRDKIEPLLDDLLDFFQNKGNTTDGALGAIIEGLTDSRMKQVNDAIDIFRTFCVGITAGNNCASLDNFQEDWATFSAYKSPPLLKPIIDQMVDLIKTFNRFSEWDSDFADFDKTVVNTVNQGGGDKLDKFLYRLHLRYVLSCSCNFIAKQCEFR